MEVLFYIGLGIQLLGAIFGGVIVSRRHANLIGHVIATAGAGISFVGTLTMLTTNPDSPAGEFDALSLYFLFVVQLVSIPTLVYSKTYLDEYIRNGKSVRSYFVFFTIMLISTQVVVVTQHAIVFLVSWEVMSLAAYLGMIYEKEKPEVQRGSFVYFLITHLQAFCLYLFFLTLHNQTGSWRFSDYLGVSLPEHVYYAALIVGLTGFGIKAGFMPLHFWLPRAHPIAPTPLSAFLSGVLLKAGIYGIFRLFEFLPPVHPAIGWVVLTVSLFSAILGVWYALAQHDIKTLLAYHSIENIGIIGIGIGIGLLGMVYHQPLLTMIGFTGALFHTLNHAIFKSLLFIGAGVVYQNLHTRDIEKMGGIVHQTPVFVTLFVIGSIAISGIPPLNGFVSEFVVFTGFFKSAFILKGYYPLFMLVMAVGLAFVGGLAVACFTKVNSIIFLRISRTPNSSFNVSKEAYVAMGLLACFCLLIGIYPKPWSEWIQTVLVQSSYAVETYSFSELTAATWVFALLIVMVGILLKIKFSLLKIRRSRVSKAWACGHAYGSPRMQYTASSYADSLITIAEKLLMRQSHAQVPADVFPSPGSYTSHVEDFAEKKLAEPLYRWVLRKIDRFTLMSQTDIRYYIAFILFILILYSGVAFLWTP